MYAEREHCGDYRMSLVDIVRNTNTSATQGAVTSVNSVSGRVCPVRALIFESLDLEILFLVHLRNIRVKFYVKGQDYKSKNMTRT